MTRSDDMDSHPTPADIEELVEVTRSAASAYIGGNIRHYFELMQHADDFTLMSPFGGEVIREPASSITDERIVEAERFFQGGECTLEIIDTHASGDLAVLIAVERQHGKVGHLPPQDWSLRVTLVFRREARRWRLVHRHADPLVHPITFEELGALCSEVVDPRHRSWEGDDVPSLPEELH
jgi:ketosteroid isomerase-like protein